VTGLFVQFVSKFSITGWVADNWQNALWWTATYLAIGIIYTIFRWQLHLWRTSRILRKLESAFRKEKKATGALTPLQKKRFGEYLAQNSYHVDIEGHRYYSRSGDSIVPTFENNKYVIGRRLWFWPWSMLGWALNDLIRELNELIWKGLRGLMDQMARSTFGEQAGLALSTDELKELESQEREGNSL
jgi:hypothetical protein